MGGFAWVTLATNDSYSLGALVLAHSLRRVGTKHDLAVLVTPGVTGAMREKLSTVFSLVQEVNVLDSKDEANLALLARPELGITFTKLHCWRLTQYEKCVFVDADTLVIRNCDELFERDELSASPDVGWPDCFNSGVFVFKPSQQTFASITSFAAAKGSFDGGDQGLLNQYFSDWAHKDISKHLPFIYNMCSTATYSYLPAFKQFGEDVRIIHFIGVTKPWLQYFDTLTGQVQPAPGTNHLQPLLQLWWNIFCENVHPQLSPVMAGIAGALAKITLGEARSPDQVAFEEHMRKQSWEQGQIDYMGRDSFDNIWKKISETLAEQPEREPSPPKTVPKPETSKIKEATPDTTEDEPATKSEAAVLAEPRRKEEEDLIGELAPDVKNIISPLPEVTPEQVSGETVSSQSTGSDAAVTTAALVSTIPQLSKLESLELIKSKNDDVTSILPTSTITTDSSAPETPKSITDDLKLDEQSQKTHPEIPSSIIPEVEKSLESSKDVKNEPIRLTEIASAEILSEGHVPIQVAESVLEADIKESVTEDLRPVTEEVISSISATAQESVPAVVETAMEAVTPEIPTPNGSANLSSEIGNGIDGLNISSPIRASVADVPPEVVDLVKTEELFKAPTVLSAQTTPEALISAEKEESLSSSMPIEELQESKVSAETESEISPVKVAEISQEAKLPEVGQDSPVELVEKAQEFESSTETQEISPISIGLTEKGQETVELSSPPLVEPSEKSEVQTSMEVQEIKLAPVEVSEKLQETTSLTKPQEISAPSVELTGQPPEEPKPSTEAPTSVEPPEKSQISSASTEPSEKPQETKVSAETIQPSSPPLVEADSKPEETKVPAETIQPSSPPLVEADSKPEETKVPGETIQPSSSPLVEADSKPQETKVPAETIQPSSPPLVEADSKPQETELPTESEKSSVSSPKAEEKAESAKSVTKEQETISCPIKPARKIELPELSLKTELPLEKKVPKDEAIEIELTEEIASQSESSEESPTRPARTKDIQIPDTPTITEATPPTSPPIGGAESLDTQQTTKVGKKVVKKVVKKTTSTESKPVEGAETEDGKKVTKKIVKKVVKKKDDEGNGEATSSSEKPKKIVKVVKKTTKTSQTLESDTTVPETPPPDAPEVPVPPKRKLKTTTKTTTAKSDSEP